MKIESVDMFYFSMPQVLDIGDGSQDMLLVRVIDSGGNIGWGECEAAPLVSIASLVCPMSHSACKPVAASVVGQKLENVADVARIGNLGHQIRSRCCRLLPNIAIALAFGPAPFDIYV